MGSTASVDVASGKARNGGGIQLPQSDAAVVATAAEGNELLPVETVKWDSGACLAMRLLHAQNDVSVLELDSTVKAETQSGKEYSYKGITAAQIVARAKSALYRQGVLYLPFMEHGSVKVDGNKTTLWVAAKFMSVDDPTDNIEIGAWGSGIDKSANGIAKAFTNANKQILAKTLCMTTVEDDVKDETPFEPDAAAAIRKEAKQDKNKTLQAWASSYKKALEGANTLASLVKLQRENKEQLMAEETPDVTRDFFVDLFEQRKAFFGGDNA